MICCDRCKKEIEIDEKLRECCPSIVTNYDYTEIWDNDGVFRFCDKCWSEIIDFLMKEGQLGTPI
jgi:hypothetical protein